MVKEYVVIRATTESGDVFTSKYERIVKNEDTLFLRFIMDYTGQNYDYDDSLVKIEKYYE